jgi:hypothetical protein
MFETLRKLAVRGNLAMKNRQGCAHWSTSDLFKELEFWSTEKEVPGWDRENYGKMGVWIWKVEGELMARGALTKRIWSGKTN